MGITLRNSLHGTAVTIALLSDGTTFRVPRLAAEVLCGVAGCSCGTICGPQTVEGHRARVEKVETPYWDEQIYRLSILGWD